jgi:hypothetical protein
MFFAFCFVFGNVVVVLFGGKGDNHNVYWDNFDLIDIGMCFNDNFLLNML